MKSIWRNSALNVVYKLVSLFFPLISSAYLARILLPEGVGRIATAQNLVTYFVLIAALGLPTYGVREIAKARDHPEQLNRTFSELLVINAISTTLAVIVYLVTILSVKRFSGDIWLYLATGLQLVFNYINIDWLYQGKEDYLYICVRSIIIKVLSLLFLFWRVKTQDDYIMAACVTSCALGLNFIFNIAHCKKYVRFTLKNLQIKKHLSPLFVLLMTTFLSSIYGNIDITMLGMLSTEEATGLYANVHKTIIMVCMTCSSMTTVLLPRLSYSYVHDREAFHKLLVQGMRLLAFVSIPMTVGLFILAPQGMTVVYGEKFAKGAEALRILSVLLVVKCFGDLLCYQLTLCTGNEKKRLPAYFCAAVSNIVLNAILIPKMAQNGAAIASVMSELVVNGIQIVVMKRIVGFKIEWKAIIQSAVAAAVMSIGVIAMTKVTSHAALQIGLSIVVGGALYVMTNILLKNEFTLSIVDTVKQRALKRR